jgi:hypothetical protein
MTILGEFSPLVDYFYTLGSFLKITEVAHITVFCGKKLCIKFDNYLGWAIKKNFCSVLVRKTVQNLVVEFVTSTPRTL